ncbi:MAG: hypothetical protein WC248_05035 [Candidatus Methanomethylophilaceae archaeon]|jgi:hypothetical protein
MENQHTGLQELTGQESGIVVYPAAKMGIVCNWSSKDGLPRMLEAAVIWSGESIPDAPAKRYGYADMAEIFKNLEIIDTSEDRGGDVLPHISGKVFDLGAVVVIAPDDWA